MSDGLKRKLRAARPKLRLVSPVSFWFIFLMGFFNIIVGVGLMLIPESRLDEPAFRVIAQILPFWLWGILFVGLGMSNLWSLELNSWKWARYTLLVGVTLQTGWAVALILRSLTSPDGVFMAVTWTVIALVQVLCYIYFLPPQEMRLFNGKKIDN